MPNMSCRRCNTMGSELQSTCVRKTVDSLRGIRVMDILVEKLGRPNGTLPFVKLAAKDPRPLPKFIIQSAPFCLLFCCQCAHASNIIPFRTPVDPKASLDVRSYLTQPQSHVICFPNHRARYLKPVVAAHPILLR